MSSPDPFDAFFKGTVEGVRPATAEELVPHGQHH